MGRKDEESEGEKEAEIIMIRKIRPIGPKRRRREMINNEVDHILTKHIDNAFNEMKRKKMFGPDIFHLIAAVGYDKFFGAYKNMVQVIADSAILSMKR